VEPLARGAFQRRNLATARAAAQALLGDARPLEPAAVTAAAASTLVPGRFEVVGGAPVTVFDGAHNPAGVAALAETLPAFVAGRRLVAVVSVLDDKDAAAMLAPLLALSDAVVACASANPRALAAGALAALAREGGPRAAVEAEPEPHAALARARALAGPDGVVLVTGSIYLVADLLRPPGAPPGATL
ncbi:MAG: bifunctional folylpolyglutamate synthase/dihydrofolate synthase, partial [Actinomycetota bacterium]|nr:bifunctional folylpolyglutamate synthase/dihydrofolate synthase [Actinomycetota bacterium]